MLYIIGLGLNEKGISLEGLEALDGCEKVYLEGYTVDFPYSIKNLEKVLGKSIAKIERKDVESDFLIKEAKNKDVALLVYGSPLFATTHLSLLEDARKAKVKTRVIFSAGVFDAISLSGLQLYKFGKITSMPDWKDKGRSESFMDVLKNNQSINAHSLILCDIGLSFGRAIAQLEEAAKNKNIKLEKIVVCSQLGTSKSIIFCDNLENLKRKSKKIKVGLPFCLIIPSNDLHFMEKEALENFTK